MTDTSVDDLLAQAAQATAGVEVPPAKKERVKKTLEGGTVPKAAEEQKAPKLYPQANEDGTQAFDEAGEPVMGPKETAFKAPKAKKAPRLDADGNPITRGSNVFLEAQVLNKVEGKGAGYRDGSKRKQFFDLITPGITVGEYYAAAGGKSVGHTYLVWYINDDQSVSIE